MKTSPNEIFVKPYQNNSDIINDCNIDDSYDLIKLYIEILIGLSTEKSFEADIEESGTKLTFIKPHIIVIENQND